MNQYFDIVVNENDETGVDFNSCVDRPAHSKQFISFGKNNVRYHFNDEKRIVTGVAIASNVWIYRNDQENGEHYVRFSPSTIELIRKKFHAQGYNNNVNVDHDMNKIVKGAVMLDSYVVNSSDPKYPNVPEAFKNQNIQDGSWFTSYYVTDDKLWTEIKEGRVLGFSIEGWFDKKKVNVKSNKMNKQKKPIGAYFKSLFNTEEEEKVTMAQVTAVDGTILMYDGDAIVIGETKMFTDLEGENVIPEPGDYEVTLEDGSKKVVTLDVAGIVTAMEDVEEMSDNEELAVSVADAMKAMGKEVAEFKTKLQSEIETLKTENATLKHQMSQVIAGGKFKIDPKKTGDTEQKGSYKDLLKTKKTN